MPFDDKGEAHGYWVRYTSNGDLWFKRTYDNGNAVGYEEYYTYWHGSRDTSTIKYTII